MLVLLVPWSPVTDFVDQRGGERASLTGWHQGMDWVGCGSLDPDEGGIAQTLSALSAWVGSGDNDKGSQQPGVP